MANARYLTKSRFKLATECPTKLYYTKKAEYADQKIDDSFLLALAEGGFQVGELAKCYFPGGVEIETLNYAKSLELTNSLLENENAIIYEAAISFENFFIRADILVKTGTHLELIEVKSKSFDIATDTFTSGKGTIRSEWTSYLFDVAFQKFVVENAFPQFTVSAFLMMADRSVQCPTDGLNQKFRISTDDDGRKGAHIVDPIVDADLTPPILCKINVDELCEQIYGTADGEDDAGRTFIERARLYSDHYSRDEKIVTSPNRACKKCEFQTNSNDEAKGLKSGFRECWSAAFGWTESDFAEPNIFEIANYHFKRADSRFKERRLKLSELVEDDVTPKPDDKPGVSQSERQWLQVSKAQQNDGSVWIDRENLSNEMRRWTFPLHFIDFETSMAAIPFNKGRRPYEGIAFQFSHHSIDAAGNVRHAGEFLSAEPGQFPNYEFLRALRDELSRDGGSIFRYADHENSYLNMIYRQLGDDPSAPDDREELLGFIRSITRSSKESVEEWEGGRSMIDMCRLVKRHFYDPHTRGSNSIKKVLPAILNSSTYLKSKYSKPIYGSSNGIPSLNYTDWTWLETKDGKAGDPYKLLPKMFADIPDDEFELISESSELNDGGAAMTAYARLQFEDMSDYERDAIKKALLKYCELDTLAMVMIYEGWREMLNEQ